jgi:hypothetical protein
MTASALRFRHVLSAALLASASLASTACDINKMVADQTASVLHQAAPALDAFFDYDLAGVGIPGAIIQLEAFLSVTPNNEDLGLNLAKAYVGYAQGWVEEEYERSWAKNDVDRADHLRARARYLYLRARDLALHAMRVRDDGIDAAIKGGENKVRAYLKEEYKDADDVAPLFWAGLAWGASINMSLDQPDLIADLPVAIAMVERAVELDDMFFNGAGYLFLATAEAAMPAAMGGNPEKARVLFEKGLARTERKNHMLHVAYARIYAVNNQKRDLFNKLLMEVIDAPDLGPKTRLSNKIARVRADRYLKEEDKLF